MADMEPWCLILAIWGQKYGSAHVNELAREARRQSIGLGDVILVTDRPRDGIDSDIRQIPFPGFFAQPDFFRGAYRAKLAIFSPEVLPPGRRCLYVDLDTVVTGDLGLVAALVQKPSDIWMMPPAGMGFSASRRLVDWVRGWVREGRNYPVGNSSLVAFHSDASPNIAEIFRQRHAAGIDVTQRYMCVDDTFISWAMRGRLRGIPKFLAVSFRREFMARIWPLLWLRRLSPFRRRRREGLVAITFNGVSVKPEQLVALPDGGILQDRHGRVGYWSDAFIGPLRQKIVTSCRRVLSDM